MSWIDELNSMPDVGKVTQYQGRVKTNPAAVPKKKNGNLFTNLVPTTLGSTGGALGGAAIGATAGSVVPVVGTIAGGLLGALIGGAAGGAGGKVVENKLEGNALGDSVGKEALISGLTSVGPGQLIKAGKVAKAGLGALRNGTPPPTSLTAAMQGTDEVAQTAANVPLKTSRQGRLLELGNRALLSQYGTISKPVARATNPTKTIGQLAEYGVTKPVDVERISGAVTGTDGIINKAVIQAVEGSSRVPIGNVRKVMDDALQANGVVEKDYKSVKQIVEAELKRLGSGDADPKTTLSVMKSLEGRIANLQGKGMNNRLTTPERTDQAQVLKAVRDELQEGLYTAAGANKNVAGVLTPQLREEMLSLNPGNPQWSKFVDNKVMSAKSVKELRSTMAPFVNGRQIIDEGDLNAMTFGGRGGNLANQVSVGGILNKVADVAGNIIKDPAARASSKVLRAAGGAGGGVPPTGPAGSLQNALSSLGTTNKGKNALGAGRVLTRNTAGQIADQSLLESEPAEAQALDQQLMDQYNLQPDVDPNAPQLLDPAETETEAPTSQFAPENVEANIQKILANGGTMKDVTQYVSLAQALQELQPKSEDTELSAQAKTSMAASANGVATLEQLESLYSNAGGGSGKLGGALANLGSKAGLNSNVQGYSDLAGSSVSQLAKALNGGGQVSDTDAAVVIQALPKITDSPKVAQIKFNALKKRLETARQNTLLYGGGGEQVTQGVQ